MTEPVTAAEIADLLHRIRHLSEDRHASPAERAVVLARKADLLARIADQPIDGWDTHHTDQEHTVAHDAQAIADRARRPAATSTSTTGGAKSQENSRGHRQPGGAKSEENSGASSG
jgi:hypothetical protein